MPAVPMSVTLIDLMGKDKTVCDAARVSFAKESTLTEDGKLRQSDQKLIRYLAQHNHWTPFGHAAASFRIKTPIFVARQLHKSQIGFVVNEVSRRYVDEPPEYWLPDEMRQRPEGSIKQGSGDRSHHSLWMIERIENETLKAIEFYNDLITLDIAPEQARMVLPLNVMTEWIWTGSLAAWARMCKLRLGVHAQKETREIALYVSQDMQKAFPVSWDELIGASLSE